MEKSAHFGGPRTQPKAQPLETIRVAPTMCGRLFERVPEAPLQVGLVPPYYLGLNRADTDT